MDYVKSIIDAWDPINILPIAPNDEYHSEIKEIQYLISMTNNVSEIAKGIFKVFVEAFGEQIFNKSEDECKQIAELLLSQKH